MAQTATQTHAMRAMIELRQQILSGELAGGTRLLEVPLSEKLGISRTPLREAMSRLTEEGLLERARNGGFMVRSFRFADVIDAIELRGVLEGTSARLAAERGAEPAALVRIHETIADLDRCFGEEPGSVDLDGYTEHNARFHEELAALSGSALVRREIERVNRLPFASPSAFLPVRAYSASFRMSLAHHQDQHKAVVGAIEAREGTRAEALTREHARGARINLERALAEAGGVLDRMPGLALVVT